MRMGSLWTTSSGREWNVSSATGHGAVDRRAKARVETAGKRIARFRADSASYQAALINALEEDGVAWVVAILRSGKF